MPLAGGLEQVGVRAVVDGFKPYMANIGMMEAKTKGFGSKIGSFLKMGALVGGAALVGLGAAALKLGGDFDKAYDTIKVGTGASGEALKGLKDDFKAVFSAIPTDMATASTAIADLNTRLGLTGEPLQQLSKQMIELSRITKTDLGANIEAVTRLFGDWDVATGDQSASLDRLFKTSQATGIGVDKLSQLVVQFGAPLRNFGFTLDESTALLAKFDKEGVNTEAVMGGLKIGLGKIAAAGKDPAEAFREVSEQIKNAGSSGEANIAAIETFGSRAGPDMAAAIREGRFEIEDFVAQMDEGGEGILETAKATESWTDKLKILKNKALVKLEPLLIGLFDGLTKLFTVIEMKVIPAMREWWQKHGPKITKFLKSDLLPTVKDIAKFLKKFFAPALDTLRDAWVNVGRPIAKLVLPILKKVGSFLLEHKPLLIAIAAAILLLVAPWLAVAAAIAVVLAKWDEISAFFIGLGKDIKKFVDDVIQKVSDFPVIGEIVKDTVRTAKIYVETQLKIIQALFQAAVDTITNIFKFWKAIFTGDWEGAWNTLKDQAKVIWTLLSSLFGIALDAVKAVFSSKLTMIKGIGSDLGHLIVDAASKIWTDLKRQFGDSVNAIGTWVTGNWGRIKGFGASVVKAVGEGMRSAIGWVKGALNALITQVEKGVNAIIDLINAIPDVKLPFGLGSIGIPNIGYVSVPRLHRGAFEIPQDMLARLQAGEMVLPRPQAEVVREAVLAPSVAPQVAAAAGGGVDPHALAAAVASALQGMTVQMDGRVVGNLVSERLGGQSFMLGRGG